MGDMELLKAEVKVEAEEMAVAPVIPERSQPGALRIEEHAAWPLLSRLALPVSAEIPLVNFKIRHLLALAVGQLVESVWSENEDIRVMAAGVQAGWSEFEVEEQKLMVRLTRLA